MRRGLGRALALGWLTAVLVPGLLALIERPDTASWASLLLLLGLLLLPWAAGLRRTALLPFGVLSLSAGFDWASRAFTGEAPSLATALALFRTTAQETQDLARVLWPQAVLAVLLVALVLAGLREALVQVRQLPRPPMSRALPAFALLLAPMLAPGSEERYPFSTVTLAARVREFQAAQSVVVSNDPFEVRRETARGPETVVFVIGESSQATHWQLFGYDKPTTPNLLRRQAQGELLAWPRHMSTASATITAVPALLNPFEQVQVGRGELRRRSLVTVLSRAGFSTRWMSTQGPQPASTEADSAHFEGSVDVFKAGTGYDNRLVPALQAWLASSTGPRAAVLHTSGNHFPFEGRYPEAFKRWSDFEGKRFPASQTVGNYDNSVLYVDHVLERLLQAMHSLTEPALFVFVADHGETLMHGTMRDQAPVDARVLHVPMFVWANEAWRQRHAEQWARLEQVLARRPATSHLDVVPTLTGLLGIDYAGRPAHRSLVAAGYRERAAVPALAPDYRTVIEVQPAP